MLRMKSKGFTLLELLIVVAIIGILVAMVIPNLLDAVDRSKQRATVASLRSWGTAAGAYMTERGVFPVQAAIAVVHVDLVPYAIGSLRDKDFWNHDLHYFTNASRDGYTVMSYGKDGIVGLGVTPATWRDFTLDIVLTDGIFINAPS